MLGRPRLLERIRKLIPNPDTCHLVAFNSTDLETELVRLGIPPYGAEPLASYNVHVGDERSRAGSGDRGSWPVVVFALGHEPGDDLSASTTAEERLTMVGTLTLEAWALAGRRVPDYARGETPVCRRPWPPKSSSTPSS